MTSLQATAMAVMVVAAVLLSSGMVAPAEGRALLDIGELIDHLKPDCEPAPDSAAAPAPYSEPSPLAPAPAAYEPPPYSASPSPVDIAPPPSSPASYQTPPAPAGGY
jgi:hypothetical protein